MEDRFRLVSSAAIEINSGGVELFICLKAAFTHLPLWQEHSFATWKLEDVKSIYVQYT